MTKDKHWEVWYKYRKDLDGGTCRAYLMGVTGFEWLPAESLCISVGFLTEN